VLGHFGHGHAVGQSKDLWIDIEVPLSPAVRFASPDLIIELEYCKVAFVTDERRGDC
jgi:hypothetical protein